MHLHACIACAWEAMRTSSRMRSPSGFRSAMFSEVRMPMTSSSWRRAKTGANHFAAGHSRHHRPGVANRPTKGAGLMQSKHSRGDAICSHARALTFNSTYSVLANFSTVPAYLEYTTFSPLCRTQATPQQQPSRHHLFQCLSTHAGEADSKENAYMHSNSCECSSARVAKRCQR